MTVGELIYQLNKLDINAEVFVLDGSGCFAPASNVNPSDEGDTVDILP